MSSIEKLKTIVKPAFDLIKEIKDAREKKASSARIKEMRDQQTANTSVIAQQNQIALLVLLQSEIEAFIDPESGHRTTRSMDSQKALMIESLASAAAKCREAI